MKDEKLSVTEQLEEYIKSQKESFRQNQRSLSFGEKMQIAFSLAERDKTIRHAVLLPKTNKKKGKYF
jgi:ribosomal protein L1